MKRCWAYQAIAGSRSAWVPCVRLPEEGSRFCTRHARAIEGAVLGALMHAEARDEAVTLYEDLAPWSGRGGKRRSPRGIDGGKESLGEIKEFLTQRTQR